MSSQDEISNEIIKILYMPGIESAVRDGDGWHALRIIQTVPGQFQPDLINGLKTEIQRQQKPLSDDVHAALSELEASVRLKREQGEGPTHEGYWRQTLQGFFDLIQKIQVLLSRLLGVATAAPEKDSMPNQPISPTRSASIHPLSDAHHVTPTTQATPLEPSDQENYHVEL